MTIAVLAVQGAFIEHEKKLQALGADVFEIRQAKDLERHFDGLVLPAERARYRESFYGSLDCLYLCRRRSERDCPLWQPVRD